MSDPTARRAEKSVTASGMTEARQAHDRHIREQTFAAETCAYCAEEKNAPGTVAPVSEGQAPLEGHQLMTSIASQSTRVDPPVEKRPKRRPGQRSIAKDGFVDVRQKPYKKATPKTRSIDEPPKKKVAALTLDELAVLPLRVRRTVDNRRTRVWVDREGCWWRTGGSLRVQVGKWDGIRYFDVVLYKGANEDDLKFFLGLIEEARRGQNLALWRPTTAEWADDKTLIMMYAGRPYYDPFCHADKSAIVYPCAEKRCTEKWHRSNGTHTLDVIEKSKRKLPIDYKISVEKDLFPDPDDPVQGWYVRHDVPIFAGRVVDVAELISDLEWAREECRQANEQSGDETAAQLLQRAHDLGVAPSTLLHGQQAAA